MLEMGVRVPTLLLYHYFCLQCLSLHDTARQLHSSSRRRRWSRLHWKFAGSSSSCCHFNDVWERGVGGIHNWMRITSGSLGITWIYVLFGFAWRWLSSVLCETRENFKTCLKFAKRNKVYFQLLSNCQLRPRILNLGSSIGDNLFFAWHSMITKGDVNS